MGSTVGIPIFAIIEGVLKWDFFSLGTVYSHDGGKGKLPPDELFARKPTLPLDVHMSRIFRGGYSTQGTKMPVDATNCYCVEIM